MTKKLLLAVLAAGCLSAVGADSLFKDPILSVQPSAIDFGSVSLKTTVRTNILVQNYGGGKLVGKATVAKPFKILSGGTYRLGPADAQVVTISYTPSAGLLDSNVVKFTGAAGGLVPVVGKPVNSTEQR